MLFRVALLLSSLVSYALALDPVHIKGSKFFTKDGNQWFIKGVAYQLVPDDPLIDAKQCNLDATLMKTLGANAIRVYHVDPAANHKPCMDIFAAAGIYLFLDLDTFTTQINQDRPTWNDTQLKAFQLVMDTFHTFDNLAGFFVGNEVLNMESGSPAAPFVKAAARDLKAYRDAKGYRKIPVGYSAADIAALRPMLQNYLACGPNVAEQIDFFALNAYEWCGDNNFQTSGYENLNNMAKTYTVPIFFSETGCQTIQPRTHDDQGAIFGPEMAPYWSGAIIYEWIQETNNYGLIQYGPHVDPSSPGAPPDGWPRSGTPIPVQPDFDNLKKQWANAKPSGVMEGNYSPSTTTLVCPARTPIIWEVDPNAPLPPAPKGASNAPGSSSSTTTSATSSKSTSTSGTTSIYSSHTASTATKSAAAIVVGVSVGGRAALPFSILIALCLITAGVMTPF